MTGTRLRLALGDKLGVAMGDLNCFFPTHIHGPGSQAACVGWMDGCPLELSLSPASLSPIADRNHVGIVASSDGCYNSLHVPLSEIVYRLSTHSFESLHTCKRGSTATACLVGFREARQKCHFGISYCLPVRTTKSLLYLIAHGI